MRKAKVVLLCLLATTLYGVLHDQITARLCVEYFTIAHPPLFKTESPTLLGLFWGISATWGLGLLFGFLLAQASQSPNLQSTSLAQLGCQILMLILTTAAAAIAAGMIGFELSKHSVIQLGDAWNDILTRSQQDRFIAVWWAHSASYAVGLLGATFMIVRIWNQRQRPSLFSLYPRSRFEFVRAAILILLAAVVFWLRWSK